MTLPFQPNQIQFNLNTDLYLINFSVYVFIWGVASTNSASHLVAGRMLRFRHRLAFKSSIHLSTKLRRKVFDVFFYATAIVYGGDKKLADDAIYYVKYFARRIRVVVEAERIQSGIKTKIDCTSKCRGTERMAHSNYLCCGESDASRVGLGTIHLCKWLRITLDNKRISTIFCRFCRCDGVGSVDGNMPNCQNDVHFLVANTEWDKANETTKGRKTFPPRIQLCDGAQTYCDSWSSATVLQHRRPEPMPGILSAAPIRTHSTHSFRSNSAR